MSKERAGGWDGLARRAEVVLMAFVVDKRSSPVAPGRDCLVVRDGGT